VPTSESWDELSESYLVLAGQYAACAIQSRGLVEVVKKPR